MTSEARFFVKRKLHKKCGVFEACKKAIGFFDTLKKECRKNLHSFFICVFTLYRYVSCVSPTGNRVEKLVIAAEQSISAPSKNEGDDRSLAGGGAN